MGAIVQRLVTGAVALGGAEGNGSAPDGDYVGLVDGQPVAGGARLEDVARRTVEHLLSEPREVLTLLSGADTPPLDALVRELEDRHPELEIELHEGGQPDCPLLLSAE
jgi:dihydroxyacetone kinase-like predicted kinase